MCSLLVQNFQVKKTVGFKRKIELLVVLRLHLSFGGSVYRQLQGGFADSRYSYVGLKLAHGEVLSPEEEAALKLAEAEFERTQNGTSD